MAKKVKNFSWGERVKLDIWHKAGDYLCINRKCENSKWNGGNNRFMLNENYIVGVERSLEGSLRFEEESHYIAIVECPVCFEKFWYHIPDTQAERLFKKITKEKKF